MVSIRDLEEINTRSDARHAKMLAEFQADLNRQLIWFAGIGFLMVVAIVAIVKL